MFRAASDDDIEAYSDSVTCFIRKCIEDVVPTKTIRIYIKTKLKNISTPTTQEACGRASTTSQALKGINQLL